MRSFLGDFPFFMKQATCALFFFPKSIWSNCAHPSPCPKGKKSHPNRASYVKDIGFQIWLLHRGNSWDHLTKRAYAYLTKIRHAWSMRFLYVILAHIVVGTTIYTFHPRRLPPIGPQTLLESQVAIRFRSHDRLRVEGPWIYSLTYTLGSLYKPDTSIAINVHLVYETKS